MRFTALLLSSLLVAPAQADDAFSRCLLDLRAPAAKAGISAPNYARFTAGLAPDPTVLEALDYQPEFKTPIWDYFAGLVDDERIADGRAQWQAHAETLRAIEQRYGVDAAVLVALWGVESDFGRIKGGRPLLQSLATLSCAGRRQPYFRSELFAALNILQSGDVTPESLRGSWAGAFGQTQFMPSTFLRIAVDFDGDGRRDLVDNPGDALASAARYLQDAGWRRGQSWGFEVALPKGFDAALAG
ncbi:MAG TPA: lytic murein transglycosylase, partial [Arenimonas sp.]|nr:lytic murein transglycosylase [Arenimonas sp.]